MSQIVQDLVFLRMRPELQGLYIINNVGGAGAIKSYGSHTFGQRSGETWNAPGVLYIEVNIMLDKILLTKDIRRRGKHYVQHTPWRLQI